MHITRFLNEVMKKRAPFVKYRPCGYTEQSKEKAANLPSSVNIPIRCIARF